MNVLTTTITKTFTFNTESHLIWKKREASRYRIELNLDAFATLRGTKGGGSNYRLGWRIILTSQNSGKSPGLRKRSLALVCSKHIPICELAVAAS